jgi:hypothetical protein
MKAYSGKAVRIKSIEQYDDDNMIVQFEDEFEPFSTMPVNDGEVYLSTYIQHSGSTDYVIGHHDGSRNSNTNKHNTYRVHGREYLNGAWYIPTDTLMIFTADYDIDFYRCAPNAKRYNSQTDVQTNYAKVQTVAKINDTNGSFYAGNVKCINDGVFVGYGPSASSTTGTGSYLDRGGKGSGIRELLMGGGLRHGLVAGSLYLDCGLAASYAFWFCCSGD